MLLNSNNPQHKNILSAKERLEKQAEPLFITVGGSRAYCLNTLSSDTDLRGIFMEPVESLFGLKEPYGSISFDSPGIDAQFFSLKQFFKLCMKGSPNGLELLYIPADQYVSMHIFFCDVIANRSLFLGKQAIYDAFMGFAKSQKNKTAKELASGNVKKAAKSQMHTVRLYMQGTDLFTYGGMTVRRMSSDIHFLMKIREGAMLRRDASGSYCEKEQFTALLEDMENKLRTTYLRSSLPDKANAQALDKLLQKISKEYYREKL